MEKVAIVSCYFKKNYGSVLQAYATQKVLDNEKIDNVTINIENNIDFKNGKRKFYKSQIFNFSFIKSKLGMIKLKIDKKINKNLRTNLHIRDSEFEKFEKNFNLTKPFNTYLEMTSESKNFSSVIVGSDQLWLPVNVVADYYTLNWVPNEVNKISYATSFGISVIPDKYKEKYNNFLRRINHISVREKNGCKLVEEISERKAELVCDPTLLLDKNEWMEIQEEKPKIEGNYIFCYFLGKNIEHRKFVERLKEKTGYKIVSLNHCDEYVKYSDKFADEIPYNIGPGEFINLIRNAKYVCTDSFHGTVFSLINNIDFFTFERFSNKNSKMSTNSRIYSLLDLVNLKNRLLKGNENIDEVIKSKIDFENVNQILNGLRKSSKKFLLEALSNSIEIQKENDKIKYIQIDDKSKCCGCTACKSICPQNAIEMKEDEEGFLYPSINMDKCVNCGLCKKVCPVLNKVLEKKIEQKAYVVNNKDENIRSQSTSGGAFTAIAEYVIDNGGVIFGATFDKDFNVEHTYVTKKDDLRKFRGSKYVQSNLKNTFQEAKEFLNQGKLVCFSGTPCQIEGLKKFLGRDYENLITVDIVCHAVPSPKFWRVYLNYQKNRLKISKISDIKFRDKSNYGYKYSTMSIKYDDKKYSEGVETDPFLRAFFGDLSDRPSCYNCAFKKQYRVSDITIWDCFTIEDFDKKLDDDKGTTRILIHSKVGKEIFEKIKNKFYYSEINPEKLVNGVKEMYKSVKINPNRAQFWKDINSMEEKEVIEKYFPINTLKVKSERIIRRTLSKTKFYKTTKKFVKKILRR